MRLIDSEKMQLNKKGIYEDVFWGGLRGPCLSGGVLPNKSSN